MAVKDMEEGEEGCETNFGIVWRKEGECGQGSINGVTACCRSVGLLVQV